MCFVDRAQDEGVYTIGRNIIGDPRESILFKTPLNNSQTYVVLVGKTTSNSRSITREIAGNGFPRYC